MNFKQPVSVLVVVHTAALDVLLLQRAAHPEYWQSVTGSQEQDEEPLETAQRELFEETGIRIAAESLQDWRLSNRFEIFPVWRHRYAPGITHNLEHVFSVQVPDRIDARLAEHEHSAFVWLPWQEAARRCFSWTNRDAILMLPLRGGTTQNPS